MPCLELNGSTKMALVSTRKASMMYYLPLQEHTGNWPMSSV